MSRRLAGLLPPDVRVWRVAVAPEGFDARFSALARRYVYRVCDDPVGLEPLRRHDVLWHPRPLNLDRMNAAAALLLGEHDFAAFCRRREGATTIRRLLRYEWVREEEHDPAARTADRPYPGETWAHEERRHMAVATVEADAFCHSMVRALIGALLVVGDGRRPVEWPAEVLAARVRDSAVNVVPALGLSLEEIRYPADDELARRAQQTRRVRTFNASATGGVAAPSRDAVSPGDAASGGAAPMAVY
jgi:tRNA pseudouridine38-40 synthase